MSVKIDEVKLLALAGQESALLRSIVEDFGVNGQSLMASIQEARKKGSEKSLKGCLHQLKGASGSLGMSSLYEMCVNLEMMTLGDISDKVLDGLSKEIEVSVQLAVSCLDG